MKDRRWHEGHERNSWYDVAIRLVDGRAIYQQRDAIAAHNADIDALEAEIERLREIGQHGCDCSSDDACLFARQRNEALAEVARLRGLLDKVR